MEATASTENKSGMSTTLIIGIVGAILIILGVGYYAIKNMMPSPSASSGGGAAGGDPSNTGSSPSTPSTSTEGTGGALVSEATKNKRHLSSYQTFKDYLNGRKREDPTAKAAWDKYNEYWGQIGKTVAADPENISADEPFVTAFMKGMDLDMSAYDVVQFKNEIKQYLANPDKLAHWSIEKVGQFLK